jgi:hypothetical protein
MFREGVVVASVDSPLRFGDQEWLDFNGICGHSNVPGGNDHWDPGRLPVDRLKSLLGANPSTPQEEPVSHVTVRPSERALIGVPIVGGGAGVKWAAATITAPAPGAAIALAQVWPAERKIDRLHGATSFAGLLGVTFRAGDEAIEIINSSPDVVVTVMIESGK